MRYVASGEAKNRFGELLDSAQREPVTIKKHGRPVAVLLSAEDYAEIEAAKLEALRAKIDRGVADQAAGRVVDGAKLFSDLRDMINRAEG